MDELSEAKEMVFQRKHVAGMAAAMVKAMKQYVIEQGLEELTTKPSITMVVSASLVVHNLMLQRAAENGITHFILKTTEQVDEAEEIIDLEKQFYKEEEQ